MNKKQLVDLGIAEEIADQIIVLHGKDIEAHKGKITTMQAELDAAKGQLTEASTQIEAFKGMDIDSVKKSAEDWKAKAEQIQAEADAKVLAFKQAHALERDLKEKFKVADVLAVKAHLKTDELKYDEKNDTYFNLEEHVTPLKEAYAAYFSDTPPAPRIVTGGNNQNVLSDPVISAMRTAAGLK